MMQSKMRTIMLMVGLLFTASFAQAIPMTFGGTLIGNPPCDITGNDDPITVKFGEVGISRIDGINFSQPFTLTVSCGNDLGNNVALFMGYDGMNANFDNRALQTSKSGLGILLSYNGTVVKPDNGDIPITMSSNGMVNIPLVAVPVKDSDPGLVLFEGPFNATGTVEIRYP
ncbi:MULTISPECIES: fimbrial protein [unclassified Providencia]|uniref:fimbrial protein n=1 Tax=unclassified Providencia TaxID=2633465 RepID=UPI00234A023D|nr:MULTISPECIES: fimbrial protein [unclassified Providencia]